VKGYMKKMPGGVLIPDDDETAAFIGKVKTGNVVSIECKQPRNYIFLQKFFTMLNVGFDAFEPDEIEYKGLPVQKNKERFRKDCIIAAGFYEPVANLNGDVRAEADSISFANMDDEEFERVYSKVADVILRRVLTNYTRDDLDDVVAQILGFV